MQHLRTFTNLSLLINITALLTACGSDGYDNPIGDSEPSVGDDEPSLLSLDWKIPSEREDNTVLPILEIQGYRIFYSKTKGSYLYTDSILVSDGSAHQFTIPAQTIPSGKYFIVMITTDTDGRESYYSDPPLEVTLLD
jgi:hypothetical protein